LDTYKFHIEGLKTDLKNCQQSEKILTEQTELFKNMVTKMEQELARTTKLNNGLRNQLNEERQKFMQDTISQGSSDFTSTTCTVDELRNQLNDKEEKISSLEKKLYQLEVNEKLDEELQKELSRLRVMATRVQELELQNISSKNQNEYIERLKIRNEELLNENEKHLREKCSFEQNFPTLKQKIEKYKQKIIFLTTKDDSNTLSLTNQDKEIIQLRTQLAISNSEKERLQQKIQYMEKEYNEQASLIEKLINQKMENPNVSEILTTEIKERLIKLEAENHHLKNIRINALRKFRN